MSRSNDSKQFFGRGFNCAQSVLMTFNEELGLDDDEAARVSAEAYPGQGMYAGPCPARSWSSG